ncbi:MAG: epimerase [Nocardioides sp.]
MRLLVLGGSRFLSRAVAVEAVRRGHDVTCACRGASGQIPDGSVHAVVDRTGELPPELTEATYDAVVDVARHPSWVRKAVAAFPGAHWVFVSTINVYADEATPGGRPGAAALHDPVHTDEDPGTSPEVYGAMKVSCEQTVLEAASAMVVRPGLIVGPDDPTGRFTYWPARLGDAADGDEVLAPGSPDDVVQIIDVRDLASWIVDSAETRRTGVYDGIGPAMPIAGLLAQAAAGAGVRPRLTWVPQEFLEQQEVEPWAGDRSVPLWLPRPAYDGMLSHDVTPSIEAGLSIRPVSDTTRDTLAWLRETPDAEVTGLTRDEERELLLLFAHGATERA